MATTVNQVQVSEHIDSYEVAEFAIHAGMINPGAEWVWTQKLYGYQELVIREITAVVVAINAEPAHALADISSLLSNSAVVLQGHGGKTIFERPLISLAATDRNADVEGRLERLERMMNVLVEQDSPAGEALRRLGGAKISHQSPTMLVIPAFFNEWDEYIIRLRIQAKIDLKNALTVRISVLGIKKAAVS